MFENESREGDGEDKQITNYAEREMKYHMLDANALREKSSLVTFTRYLMKLPIFVINATQKHFEQPYYQTYLTFESLLIKVVHNEGFSKEPLLGTDFSDADIVLERLNFYFKIFKGNCAKSLK